MEAELGYQLSNLLASAGEQGQHATLEPLLGVADPGSGLVGMNQLQGSCKNTRAFSQRHGILCAPSYPVGRPRNLAVAAHRANDGNGQIVRVILESKAYMLVTFTCGYLVGRPLQVNKDTVLSIQDFE